MTVRDGLSRDDFTEERIAALTAEADRCGDFPILSREAREATRRAALARWTPGTDLWLFGYGSLMWNPAIHVAERRPGAIRGWHRRFCLWTPLGRGTPDRPGLMLALEPGGRCRGIALRIAAEAVESETVIVWRREMLTGAYRARWVRVETDGGPLDAITFVVDRRHPRYAGVLSDAETARAIAHAEGRLGRCCDYLRNTVQHLDALGVADGPMHRLHALVERERAAASAG